LFAVDADISAHFRRKSDGKALRAESPVGISIAYDERFFILPVIVAIAGTEAFG